MQWKKLGCIIKPNGSYWMKSHAQNPFAVFLDDHTLQIHFAGRNAENLAHGGYGIFDLKHLKLKQISESATIAPGHLGAFDDCGTMPSCIVENNGKKYMYYTGWSKAVRTPFTFFIGLAIQNSKNQFERYSLAPILGRNHFDPYLTASPWVIREKSRWRMWYVSCQRWSLEHGHIKHSYRIKHADSSDGITWTTNDHVCIDFINNEYAIARPTVHFHNGIYTMWYCYRGGTNTYRAGYAESQNGIEWKRLDNQVGIDVSTTGWDSEMICYPCVFEYNKREYLLYNGNNYGQTGIGLAVREK